MHGAGMNMSENGKARRGKGGEGKGCPSAANKQHIKFKSTLESHLVPDHRKAPVLLPLIVVLGAGIVRVVATIHPTNFANDVLLTHLRRWRLRELEEYTAVTIGTLGIIMDQTRNFADLDLNKTLVLAGSGLLLERHLLGAHTLDRLHDLRHRVHQSLGGVEWMGGLSWLTLSSKVEIIITRAEARVVMVLATAMIDASNVIAPLLQDVLPQFANPAF
jgi:hypothetical protein